MALVKLNNRGVRSATTFGSISALGEMRFISKQTASSSATISFTSGIDSTYKEYLFTFNNIHPSANSVLSFQGNAAGGSGYNETVTCTHFQNYHEEDDGGTGFGYDTGSDLAQSTNFIPLTSGSTAINNDDCMGGEIILFNPSSTTFVKHFIAKFTNVNSTSDPNANSSYVAGYFNTTSAIDEIQFKMSSGDIDAGDICLYGIN